MELSFLGRRTAFNPKKGNNSAYFIENNQLFLIAYGETFKDNFKCPISGVTKEYFVVKKD